MTRASKTPITTLEWRGLIDSDRIIYHRFHRRNPSLGKSQIASYRRLLSKELFDECYNLTCCLIIMRMNKDRLTGHFLEKANTNSYSSPPLSFSLQIIYSIASSFIRIGLGIFNFAHLFLPVVRVFIVFVVAFAYGKPLECRNRHTHESLL